MSSVPSRNTTPEVEVRRALHALGYRFRVHYSELPGTPDIVLPKHRIAIFVNGCFWHGHACSAVRTPTSNTAYWIPKIESNRRRDRAAVRECRRLGWRPIVLWECALRRRGPSAVVASAMRAASRDSRKRECVTV